MAGSGTRTSVGTYGLMAMACIATLAIAVILVQSTPRRSFWRGEPRDARPVPAGVDAAVVAVLTSGSITVSRALLSVGFRVEPGQSLDARLPAGPFTATITARLAPGRVREANLGAQWQGGQLIIRRRGEVILSDFAGAVPRQAMTIDPGPVLASAEVVEFEFTSDGTKTSGLRGLWQPLESLVPLPLQVRTMPLHRDARERGMELAQHLNCAACHRSLDDDRQALLTASRAPVLGAVGARARPEWLRRWLRDPSAVKPGARMPGLAHGGGLSDEEIEDLVHFLASMGGPLEEESNAGRGAAADDGALAATGRMLYHRIGCVPCHAPLEALEALEALATPPGRAGDGAAPWRNYAPLDGLAAKTTADRLAAFLRDPLASRPSGLMPAQQLDELEAEAIAVYLIERDAADGARSSSGAGAFALDAARAERGKAVFARAGCADCHDLGPDRTPVASTLEAPLLDPAGRSFLADAERADLPGCLSRDPAPGTPRYDLSAAQWLDLRAFLESLAARRSEDVPLDALLASVGRLNCTGCHAFHGDLGPESAILPYFVTNGEADLGDERRLPPNLTNAGARMTRAWMHDVLAGGERARPYIATRMPDYGAANVDRLPDLLAAAAGATAMLDREPKFSIDRASAGRELVGAGGLDCIQCHEIAGNDSTGTPGPDLALMPGRLRFEGFARWLHDPARIRPGTRMPSFFVAGRSAATHVLGGRAELQVEAIWAYLSQGEMLALPDGFALTFTKPLDRTSAGDETSYAMASFTHHRWQKYGSPEIERQDLRVRRVQVAGDRLGVRLFVDGLRPRFVHELRLDGVRSAEGEELVHPEAFYTLNVIPRR